MKGYDDAPLKAVAKGPEMYDRMCHLCDVLQLIESHTNSIDDRLFGGDDGCSNAEPGNAGNVDWLLTRAICAAERAAKHLSVIRERIG